MIGFLRREAPTLLGIIGLLLLSTIGQDRVGAPDQPIIQGLLFAGLCVVILIIAFHALSHASVLEKRLGQPLGSLVLTLSILSIEVSLIVSIMLTGQPDPTMARDTMFAGLMMTLNGVVGIVLLVGGLRHRQQDYNLEGARAYIAALIPLAVIGLVLPSFARDESGQLSDLRFVAIGVATILYYGIFLGVQTMRHREFFADREQASTSSCTPQTAYERQNLHDAIHFALLFAALLTIALLGRQLAKIVDFGVHELGVPTAAGGILIAILTLTPESVTAIRAALANKLQQSINVFLGGALSTIGLTIPCVLIVAFVWERKIILGLQGTDLVLLLLTLFVSSLTFGGVRTNVLQGAVHLLIFLMYIVFIIRV